MAMYWRWPVAIVAARHHTDSTLIYGRAVPVWQLPCMLYLATAIAGAMAATGPEGAHRGDAHTAELLTIQNGGLD